MDNAHIHGTAGIQCFMNNRVGGSGDRGSHYLEVESDAQG